MKNQISRREFIAGITAAGFGALAASATEAWALEAITNPLAAYPDRGWERVYRDLWKYDSKYTFTCAPNDTHNCLLNAYVRQGVITRIGPTMRYGEAKDLAGKGSTHRWDPRVCQKGLALTRRFYGDRRVNQCMVRAGFTAGRKPDSRAAKMAARMPNTSNAPATNGCGCRTPKPPRSWPPRSRTSPRPTLAKPASSA